MTSEHEFQVRVYYEDTDVGGIVYHANYLCFAERARSELLLDHGLRQSVLMDELGVAFVVRSAHLDYQAPARLEDVLCIRSSVRKIGGSRLDLVQNIYCEDRLLVSCNIALVTISADIKPVRIPGEIREIMTIYHQAAV